MTRPELEVEQHVQRQSPDRALSRRDVLTIGVVAMPVVAGCTSPATLGGSSIGGDAAVDPFEGAQAAALSDCGALARHEALIQSLERGDLGALRRVAARAAVHVPTLGISDARIGVLVDALQSVGSGALRFEALAPIRAMGAQRTVTIEQEVLVHSETQSGKQIALSALVLTTWANDRVSRIALYFDAWRLLSQLYGLPDPLKPAQEPTDEQKLAIAQLPAAQQVIASLPFRAGLEQMLLVSAIARGLAQGGQAGIAPALGELASRFTTEPGAGVPRPITVGDVALGASPLEVAYHHIRAEEVDDLAGIESTIHPTDQLWTSTRGYRIEDSLASIVALYRATNVGLDGLTIEVKRVHESIDGGRPEVVVEFQLSAEHVDSLPVAPGKFLLPSSTGNNDFTYPAVVAYSFDRSEGEWRITHERVYFSVLGILSDLGLAPDAETEEGRAALVQLAVLFQQLLQQAGGA